MNALNEKLFDEVVLIAERRESEDVSTRLTANHPLEHSSHQAEGIEAQELESCSYASSLEDETNRTMHKFECFSCLDVETSSNRCLLLGVL